MKSIRFLPAAVVVALAMTSCTGSFFLGAGASGAYTAPAAVETNSYRGVARVNATIVIQPKVTVASHSKFFGVPIGGSSVSYVIDTSGSMESLDPGGATVSDSVGAAIGLALLGAAVGDTVKMRKIDTARSELNHMLDSMPPSVAFNLRAFNDRQIPFYSDHVYATPENVSYARAFVDGLEPSGGTVIIESLEAALATGSETVVLLSDGLPNDTEEPQQILDMVAQYHASTGVVVHVVGLGMGQDDEFLSTIASSTGGAYAIR